MAQIDRLRDKAGKDKAAIGRLTKIVRATQKTNLQRAREITALKRDRTALEAEVVFEYLKKTTSTIYVF